MGRIKHPQLTQENPKALVKMWWLKYNAHREQKRLEWMAKNKMQRQQHEAESVLGPKDGMREGQKEKASRLGKGPDSAIGCFKRNKLNFAL